MAPSYRVGRIAWIGMVVTILAITIGTLVAGASTRRLTKTVAESTALARAYATADEAVAAEVTLEREYRLSPESSIRTRYRHHREALLSALAGIERTGSPDDRALVAKLRVAHSSYDRAILRMFDAIDADDLSLTRSIETYEVAPAHDEIDRLIDGAADEHARAADTAVADLYRLESLVLLATWIGFAVGMIMTAAFGLLLGRYQRELMRRATDSAHQATHDPLTGLPNRILFTDRLGQALATSRRDGAEVAVLVLDLDRFKEVNDMLGQRCGDDLLRSVGDRLRDVLRASDTVARLAGDEFAVLLPGAGMDAGRELAERALRELHRSFRLGDVTVDIEISIGVAVAPLHTDAVEELIRCADVAMYRAKEAKTGVVMYDPGTPVSQPNRLVMLGELRRALEQPKEVVLHYQPKIGLHGDQLCGVEAVVRWNHPTRGTVPPGEFIAMAESTGLIYRLTVRVLTLALAQVRTWLDDGREVPVAVNLSPRCLLDATLPDRVRELLVEHRVPARMLRLEVTETAVMVNPGLAMKVLTGLHQLGVRLSIDDYGTGYSSMAYLKRLPVDELKIDRSFVVNMTTSDNDAILVRSAIELGHNLGLTIVAEGVELADHVRALRGLGCDIAQGFHYARPMPPGELVDWLRASGRDTRVGPPASVRGA